MNKEKKIYLIIDILKMDVIVAFSKIEVSGILGIHRNSLRFTNGKYIKGGYVALEKVLDLRNVNMVRDINKRKKRA